MTLKRMMIAGVGSGCGKTTVSCALLSALSQKGLEVVSFKSGPDYIDPMFHEKASGMTSRNLDLFLMGEDAVKATLSHYGANRDIAVIEGAMGLYDGIGQTDAASANALSLATDTPVVLVAGAKGKALSLCAEIAGFQNFMPNNIAAVILNNVSAAMFSFYKQLIEQRLNLPVLGYLPTVPEAAVESRHLGLVTAGEIKDIRQKLALLGQTALQTINVDALLAIAALAKPIAFTQALFPEPVTAEKPVIYVSSDEAFCFAYADNLRILEALGAEVRRFSPLHDGRLPDDACGLVLWGGYPELYAKELAANQSMKASIARRVQNGLPVYAECGGFMFLQQSLTTLEGETFPMCGVLPGDTKMTKGLQNFGYVTLKANRNNLLCQKGETLAAHSFHHSAGTAEGDCFTAVKAGNGATFNCIAAENNIVAGYPHIHFAGSVNAAKRFVGACAKWKRGLKWN